MIWPRKAAAGVAATIFAFGLCGKGPVRAAEQTNAPIKAEIILTRDTYELDPAMSGEAFRQKARARRNGGELPRPPKVELKLRLANVSQQDLTLTLGGDESAVDLELTGPGALNLSPGLATTMEFRSGKPVVIKPGEHHDLPVASLASGPRNSGRYSYWTEPGEYGLMARLTCRGGKQRMTLAAPPVKIKVVPPGKALETTPVK